MWEDVQQKAFKEKRDGIWNDPIKVRAWAIESIDSSSRLAQCYRKLQADIDGDLARASEYFSLNRVSPAPDQEAPEILRHQFQYELKYVWRYLLRRYAFREALQVHQALAELEEPPGWRLWRLKDLLMLRVAVGVLLGFLVLSSSGYLYDAAFRAAPGLYFWVWLVAGVLLVLGMAAAEVQRRVGRRPCRVILVRAVWIAAAGFAYGAFGSGIQYFAGRDLGFGLTPRVAVLCGVTAVLLSFVFQHFWQEQSIGDPL
jgi:hypothetical protein